MNNKLYRIGIKAILESEYLNPKGGVYQIRCISNDSIYIGSTNNFERRFKCHLFGLKNKKHSNYKLQIDFLQFGEENFAFEILLDLGKNPNRDKLYTSEQYYIDTLKPQYNIQLIVERTVFTQKPSADVKKTVKRLAEGVTGRELRGLAPKKEKAPKKKKYGNPVKKRKYKHSDKPSRKAEWLKDMNKQNDLVNARRKELGK